MRSISTYNLKTGCKIILCIFSLLFTNIITVNAGTDKEDFNYDALPFKISNIKEHIITVDMDGDGLKDILCSKDSGITIYFQINKGNNKEAFNFNKPDISFELPGDAVGWDLDFPAAVKYTDNTNTGKRIVAVKEGKSIIAWSIINHSLTPPAILLEDLPGYLPKGAYTHYQRCKFRRINRYHPAGKRKTSYLPAR